MAAVATLPPLEFDAERHVYSRGGIVVPGVTSVLEPLTDWSMVSDGVLELARERGTLVHELTALDDRGELDEESVDPRLAGFLAAWRAFKRDTGFTSATGAIELQVESFLHGYAGTLDRLGRHGADALNADAPLALYDVKTGPPQPATALQTAAYRQAANETFAPTKPIARRFGVHLRRDGTYRLVEYRDPGDLATFLAALRLHTWRLRNA